MFGIYSFAFKGLVYQYIVQVNDILMVCYLLWRVETLSYLGISQPQDLPIEADDNFPLSIRNNIEPLLKQYCEESQLYLQHDISVTELAKLIGTNRVYLSKYFASQGITYNTYINGLRIKHFIKLYHETIATFQPMKTKQLAYQSGFRSYSTFSAAFKQIMRMNATEWMRNHTK